MTSCEQPEQASTRRKPAINILIRSMAYGGAERIVYDIVKFLGRDGTNVTLFVWSTCQSSYPLDSLGNTTVIQLDGLQRREKLQRLAAFFARSAPMTIFTHLMPSYDLAYLWNAGISTVPVIHNSKEGWKEPANVFNHPCVPFIVTCCDSVSVQLLNEGCRKRLVTIRHQVFRNRTYDYLEVRSAVRQSFGIDERILLIGMVGEFKPQKAYGRALDILAGVRKLMPTNLMVIGGRSNSQNELEYQKFIANAYRLGVSDYVTVVDGTFPVDRFYCAFDVYLNCSNYEGLSIATMEAIEHRVPIVVSNVGGQAELVRDARSLVDDPSNVQGYIERVIASISRSPQLPFRRSHEQGLIPKIWCMLAKHLSLTKPPHTGVLFITNNLNPGGAQKSLTRLLSSSEFQSHAYVCLVSEIYNATNFDRLRKAGIPIWTLYAEKSLSRKVECLLSIVEDYSISTVCFWNVEPRLKLLLSKVISVSPLRIVDVSPGSMYFEEIEGTKDFQHEIAWTIDQYFDHLTHFVFKYSDGISAKYYERLIGKSHIIRNGISITSDELALPAEDIPSHFDPSYRIGTCCRIAPVKKIEWLIEVLCILTILEPRVSLTIVGGFHPSHAEYWAMIQQLIASRNLQNIYFPGHVDEVNPYLLDMKVFLLVSEPAGCPNASIEAMASGLPIVATRYGGALDQVEDHVNGFLVSPTDPNDMAIHVAKLLRDPILQQRMSSESIKKVTQQFSMKTMARDYANLLISGQCGR